MEAKRSIDREERVTPDQRPDQWRGARYVDVAKIRFRIASRSGRRGGVDRLRSEN
jgi:hypothetical protein